MLSLFNILDSSFFITLGVILLVSGIIMLYCYRRLNLLESSIIEHGRILQTFIMNYNNQIMNTSNYKISTDAVSRNNNKIDISDDEDNNKNKLDYEYRDEKDDDEDDEDEEDDEEDEDDEDDEDHEDDEDDEDHEDDEDDDDDEENDDDDDDNQYKHNTENIIVKNLKVQDISLESMDKEEFDFYNDVTIIDKDLNNNIFSSKIVNLNNEDLTNVEKTISKNEPKGISKMKVDDLRVLAVTKNKLNNEEANKLKKKELIQLLQN